MSGPVQSFRVFVHRHRKLAALLSSVYTASVLAVGMLFNGEDAQVKGWAALFCVLAAGGLLLLVKGALALSEKLGKLSGGRIGDALQIFFVFLTLFQFVFLGVEFFRSFNLLYVPLFGALEGVFLACIYRKVSFTDKDTRLS